MSFRLADLAVHIRAEIEGDPERRVERLRGLDVAGEDDLSFLTDLQYLRQAKASRAGALVVPRAAAGLQNDLLLCDDPAVAMAELLELFHPREALRGGVHPTAVIGQGCSIAKNAYVGPYAVIGDGCEIGEECEVHAQAHLASRVRLGRGVVLHPHVSVYENTEIGDHVIVHSGTVLGADGHGYLWREGGYRKIPQVGHVFLEEGVEIGANSAVDRATMEVTRVGRGTKIDNLVQVGHNVSIGENGMLCAQAGIAGSTRVGSAVVMAGQSGMADHLRIGDGVKVGAKSAVLRDAEAEQALGGIPAIEYSKWRRQSVMLGRLEEMNRRIRALEKRLRELEDREQ